MKTRIKETIKKNGKKVYNAQCRYKPKQLLGWYIIPFTNWQEWYIFFLVPILGQVMLLYVFIEMLISFSIDIVTWQDIFNYKVSYFGEEIERYSIKYDSIDAAKKRVDQFIENDNDANSLLESKKIIVDNKLRKKDNKTKTINYIKYP